MTRVPTPPSRPLSGSLSQIDERSWRAVATDAGDGAVVDLWFPAGPAFVLDEGHVLPSGASVEVLNGTDVAWVLPESPTAAEPAWLIRADGRLSVTFHGAECRVRVQAAEATLIGHRARPHADVHGDELTLDFPGTQLLADAVAGFYWGTMLPSVIERTGASGYPDPEGYVLSTLADRYAGTYPDVDHEFQIKGRLAWGSQTDLDVVRRMIELQLRMMREDPQQLWRDPCAVQPDGTREYHVRRNSLDGTANAVMFLVTGNVEVLESIWLYVARTKDLAWLETHLADIEGAASCVEDCIDSRGRLWSDVYYEDQVIKDGRETFAASLAARSFELLAELETLLGKSAAAERYRELAGRRSAAIAEPLPSGYWDEENQRFTDWVDRSGEVHDHIHLLANVLPVLFGQARPAQAESVLELVDRELDEFQRFPTFLAARIADYTDAEIGDGGPYDLCAAGRYWCWDAAFWQSRRNGRMLLDQLQKVAAQGAADDWIMGERYDMNHVYYTDGTNWHGAAHYYEYPCVFSWVLFHEFLGLRPSLDADLLIEPCLTEYGSVTLRQSAYQLRYEYAEDGFTLHNLADETRRFQVDLTALDPAAPAPGTVVLGPGESLRIALELVK